VAISFSSLQCEKPLCYNRGPFSLATKLSVVFLILEACIAEKIPGGEMNVHETLYLRDDEMDEFGDSGAYGESLEEDYEEEEEEEEAELPGVTDSEVGAETPMPAPSVPAGGGGGGSSKPAAKKAAPKKAAPKKAAPKKAAKKKAPKKAAKKKPARKAAKKKAAKKKPAKKAKKKAGKKAARRRR
jgi:outer membrane biosynthesis protein TonB